MTNDPPPPVTWEIDVLNVLNHKPGHLLVEASVGRVVLVPPPGSGHIVPSQSLQSLHDALNIAKAVADLQAESLPYSPTGAHNAGTGESVGTAAAAAHLTTVLQQLPAEIRRLIANAMAHEEQHHER